jgi:hypothetical protein
MVEMRLKAADDDFKRKISIVTSEKKRTNSLKEILDEKLKVLQKDHERLRA